MAQGRMLKRKITKSKKMAALKTDKARLLWFYMLPFTDVEGRIEADAEDIREEIIRKQRKGYTLERIENCLQDLHQVGLITLYNANNKRYLEFTRFDDEQKNRNRDREAKSDIPAPNQGGLSEYAQTTPNKVKLSKVKLSKDNITVIFDKWNSYKGQGKWKSHDKLSYEIETAIAEQLKYYSLEDLCGAIENYAKILISPDYKWTYAWTLRQFLTRHEPKNRSELQLFRFLPNSFHDKDYITDTALQKRISKGKKLVVEPRPEPTKEEKEQSKIRAEKFTKILADKMDAKKSYTKKSQSEINQRKNAAKTSLGL